MLFKGQEMDQWLVMAVSTLQITNRMHAIVPSKDVEEAMNKSSMWVMTVKATQYSQEKEGRLLSSHVQSMKCSKSLIDASTTNKDGKHLIDC